jgi:hypothetical protein
MTTKSWKLDNLDLTELISNGCDGPKTIDGTKIYVCVLLHRYYNLPKTTADKNKITDVKYKIKFPYDSNVDVTFDISPSHDRTGSQTLVSKTAIKASDYVSVTLSQKPNKVGDKVKLKII